MKALLDTHILLWWLEDGHRLSARQRRVLQAATPESPLLVSAISLWEIATLVELGRVRLKLPLRDWLEQACAPPLVRLCPITAAIAAQVAALPASFHRDPAHRIIVSTALLHGATLLTRDSLIADSGLVAILG